MAIVTRYFSTTGNGAADGTTWNDRAALFSAGNWSTVITGFSFAGSDSLVCRIGPGSYTCSQSLASGLFANAPTAANPLFLHGCDSSGNLLTPPDADWMSCQPAWDDSGLAVIATTTNIATVNLSYLQLRLLKFTGSGRNGAVLTMNNTGNNTEWCVVVNSTANTSAVALTASKAYACVCSCTGSSYSRVIDAAVSGLDIVNCRASGVTGSSGSRQGIVCSAVTGGVYYSTVYGVGGDGIAVSNALAGVLSQIHRNTVANVGAVGILLPSTASQTNNLLVSHNMVTGCGTYGIDGQSAARVVLSHNRFRDNATANINGLGNYPTDLDNYTTDSDDSTEYVDASSTFDFRVKNTAGIWGGGYGAGDQPASASGGAAGRRNMRGGFIN
jgi:hypothetical protein